MSQSIEVNPEWIIWSRKSLNYSVEGASKKLKIKPSTLEEWELTGRLTYKNINKLANLYILECENRKTISFVAFFKSNASSGLKATQSK